MVNIRRMCLVHGAIFKLLFICFLIKPGQQGASQANGEGELLYHEVEGHYSKSPILTSLCGSEERHREVMFFCFFYYYRLPFKSLGPPCIFF